MPSSRVLKDVDMDALRKWLHETHGRTIRAPDYFLKMGFSPEFVAEYDRAHSTLR